MTTITSGARRLIQRIGKIRIIMPVIGLKLGRKLGTVTGERDEVVAAVMLVGLFGVMAMGWLLPRRVDVMVEAA